MPQGIKTKSSGVAPYRPKSKADESYRKQMFSDSTKLFNSNPSDPDLKPIPTARKPAYQAELQNYKGGDKTGNSTVYDSYSENGNRYMSTKIAPTKATSTNPGLGQVSYDAPKQKVLPYEDNTKLKPRGIKVQSTPEKLPTNLAPVATTPFKAASLATDRAATKVTYTPSTKPGYENMREYGTYAKNGAEVIAPRGTTPNSLPARKAAVQPKATAPEDINLRDEKVPLSKLEKGSDYKFAQGTKGIKTKSGMSNFINGESDKIKNMSDEQLKDATMKNMNYQNTKQNAVEKTLLDETVNRKVKKQGGYADGTKGIKTSGMKNFIENKGAKTPEEVSRLKKFASRSNEDIGYSTLVKREAAYKEGGGTENGRRLMSESNEESEELKKRGVKTYAFGTKGIKTKKMR